MPSAIPTSPLQSDEDSAESSTGDEDIPTYSVEELAEIFLDFYTFLTKLHYDPADLKIPPSGGWPDLTPESYSEIKSDHAIEVMRHLPYFNSNAAIHYKSALVDYTVLERGFFRTKDWREDGMEFWSNEGEVDSAHVFHIAWGHESGGRSIILNTLHGEIIEDIVRCDTLSPEDVVSYFDNLKEAYRSLKLIPCRGRVTIEADDVEEREAEITEAQVRAQAERWGTDLDIQFVRQIYRQYGWPDAFRRDDAMKVVEGLSDSLEEERDGWECD